MDGEQKSTALGVTHAIDSHIQSRDTYGEALRDLDMIFDHIVERIENLREFYAPVAPPPSEDK